MTEKDKFDENCTLPDTTCTYLFPFFDFSFGENDRSLCRERFLAFLEHDACKILKN
jgi:hypothetical protein